MGRTLAGEDGSNSSGVVAVVASPSVFFSSSMLLADGGDMG